MKICVINGKNAKGTTYKIGNMLVNKLGGEVQEFFLPKDSSSMCVGCRNCFMRDEKLCPHYKDIEFITKAMDEADVIIFTSPVYVYHITGALKSFLDHYGYRWMAHRPVENMFLKQAVIISTAAGAGCKSTNKDVDDSLFYWGIPKRYKLGYAVRAKSYDEINPKLIKKIEKDTTKVAKKIKRNVGKIKPGFKTKFMFRIFRMIHSKGKMSSNDTAYWKEKGWLGKKRPWKK